MFGFLRKLIGSQPKLPRRRFVKIVGESNYQQTLLAIVGSKTEDGYWRGWAADERPDTQFTMRANVIPEDNNPYDPMAVRVEVQGKIVGYLSRYQARQFRKRSETAVGCEARIVGGWDRGPGDTGHFGVELDLTL